MHPFDDRPAGMEDRDYYQQFRDILTPEELAVLTALPTRAEWAAVEESGGRAARSRLVKRERAALDARDKVSMENIRRAKAHGPVHVFDALDAELGHRSIYVPPPVNDTPYERRVMPYWESLENRATDLRHVLRDRQRQAAATWDERGQRSLVSGGAATARDLDRVQKRLARVERDITVLLNEGGLDALLKDPESEIHSR